MLSSDGTVKNANCLFYPRHEDFLKRMVLGRGEESVTVTSKILNAKQGACENWGYGWYAPYLKVTFTATGAKKQPPEKPEVLLLPFTSIIS